MERYGASKGKPKRIAKILNFNKIDLFALAMARRGFVVTNPTRSMQGNVVRKSQ